MAGDGKAEKWRVAIFERFFKLLADGRTIEEARHTVEQEARAYVNKLAAHEHEMARLAAMRKQLQASGALPSEVEK